MPGDSGSNRNLAKEYGIALANAFFLDAAREKFDTVKSAYTDPLAFVRTCITDRIQEQKEAMHPFAILGTKVEEAKEAADGGVKEFKKHDTSEEQFCTKAMLRAIDAASDGPKGMPPEMQKEMKEWLVENTEAIEKAAKKFNARVETLDTINAIIETKESDEFSLAVTCVSELLPLLGAVGAPQAIETVLMAFDESLNAAKVGAGMRAESAEKTLVEKRNEALTTFKKASTASLKILEKQVLSQENIPEGSEAHTRVVAFFKRKLLELESSPEVKETDPTNPYDTGNPMRKAKAIHDQCVALGRIILLDPDSDELSMTKNANNCIGREMQSSRETEISAVKEELAAIKVEISVVKFANSMDKRKAVEREAQRSVLKMTENPTSLRIKAAFEKRAKAKVLAKINTDYQKKLKYRRADLGLEDNSKTDEWRESPEKAQIESEWRLCLAYLNKPNLHPLEDLEKRESFLEAHLAPMEKGRVSEIEFMQNEIDVRQTAIDGCQEKIDAQISQAKSALIKAHSGKPSKSRKAKELGVEKAVMQLPKMKEAKEEISRLKSEQAGFAHQKQKLIDEVSFGLDREAQFELRNLQGKSSAQTSTAETRRRAMAVTNPGFSGWVKEDTQEQEQEQVKATRIHSLDKEEIDHQKQKEIQTIQVQIGKLDQDIRAVEAGQRIKTEGQTGPSQTQVKKAMKSKPGKLSIAYSADKIQQHRLKKINALYQPALKSAKDPSQRVAIKDEWNFAILSLKTKGDLPSSGDLQTKRQELQTELSAIKQGPMQTLILADQRLREAKAAKMETNERMDKLMDEQQNEETNTDHTEEIAELTTKLDGQSKAVHICFESRESAMRNVLRETNNLDDTSTLKEYHNAKDALEDKLDSINGSETEFSNKENSAPTKSSQSNTHFHIVSTQEHQNTKKNTGKESVKDKEDTPTNKDTPTTRNRR